MTSTSAAPLVCTAAMPFSCACPASAGTELHGGYRGVDTASSWAIRPPSVSRLASELLLAEVDPALVVGGLDPRVDEGRGVGAGDADEERQVFGEPSAAGVRDLVEPGVAVVRADLLEDGAVDDEARGSAATNDGS